MCFSFLNAFFLYMYTYIQTAGGSDYEELLRSLDSFRRVCARVLSPHVTNATLSKMASVFEYIGEPSRVKKLMEGNGEGEKKCSASLVCIFFF